MSESAPEPKARLRPRLYGVALYLVAGIMLLQLIFCLSVFFLRPYANSKTPSGILQQERVRATDAVMGSIFRFAGQGKQDAPQPHSGTNAPVQP